MKKFLSIIIALVTLLLVSCASTTPAESAEPSWITSIISTTASAQEATTATPWTSAEPTVYTHTEATTATTATTSTQGAITPTSPFVPSGYMSVDCRSLETKSKVIIGDYSGTRYYTMRAAYYYSKADGEFYPFCFDPFCEHKPYKFGSDSISCIGSALLFGNRTSEIYYYNSRIYFVFDGTIYSCSEFATDLRKEIVMEDLSYLSKEEYYKRRNQNLLNHMTGDSGSLFFNYINPDGKMIWYRYDTKTKNLIDMTEKINATAEKMGIVLYPSDVAGGHIFMYGGKTEYNLSWNYVADLDLNEIHVYDDYGILETLFETDDGLIMQASYKSEVFDIYPDIDYGERSLVLPDGRNYDVILMKTDGTVETLIKDARKTFGFKDTYLNYINDKYIYFGNVSNEKIGLEQTPRGIMDLIASFNGKIYRYDRITGEIDVFFESGDDFCDFRSIEYVNEEENVAIIKSQIYMDTHNDTDGERVFVYDTYILKCHLDSKGVVDGYEIVDFSEI